MRHHCQALLIFLCVCGGGCFGIFWDSVSLYSPGCPGTHSEDQAGLELRNLPASASQVLGLQACATMPSLYLPSFARYVSRAVFQCFNTRESFLLLFCKGLTLFSEALYFSNRLDFCLSLGFICFYIWFLCKWVFKGTGGIRRDGKVSRIACKWTSHGETRQN